MSRRRREGKSVFPKDAQEDSLTDVFTLVTSFSSSDEKHRKKTQRLVKNREAGDRHQPRWEKPGLPELFRWKQEDRRGPDGQFLAQIEFKMTLRSQAPSRERFLMITKLSTKI